MHEMDADFEAVCDHHVGRESTPSGQLSRGLLIQMLITVRSERRLMEQLGYTLLFRWFVGLEMNQAIWHHSTFSASRDRLLRREVIHTFFNWVLQAARTYELLSDKHFSINGTLIEALGSMKNVLSRAPESNEKPPAAQDGLFG